MSEKFEVVIFTASLQYYADKVLSLLDPQNKFITHRLYRNNCVITPRGTFVKDLRIFSNRNLKDIVLVDNSVVSFYPQPQNGIPIIPYFEDPKDTELLKLELFLNYIEKIKDVRPFLHSYFRLYKYEKANNVYGLYESLFLKKQSNMDEERKFMKTEAKYCA